MVKKEKIIERDLELENTLGNICIAQFQLQKLYDRLGNRFSNVSMETNEKATQFSISHQGNVYRITMIAEKQAIAKSDTTAEPARNEGC